MSQDTSSTAIYTPPTNLYTPSTAPYSTTVQTVPAGSRPWPERKELARSNTSPSEPTHYPRTTKLSKRLSISHIWQRTAKRRYQRLSFSGNIHIVSSIKRISGLRHFVQYRSGCHDTTSINGVYWKDPKGSHYTFSYKEQAQIDRNSHETFHIYVSGPDDWTMGEVTHYVEQYDDLRLHRGNNPWPTAEGALTHVGSMEFQLRLRLCVRLCVNSLEAGSLLLADRSCIYYDRRIVNLVYTNPE